MHHLRCVFTKEKEEKAKFKLESKEKLKDEKKDKVKDKDKEKVKEKDKEKFKEKEKDKKDKKLTKVPSTVTAGVPFEEIFTLGVALPIFGVPLSQSVERSRCHDDTSLPLLVRDAIDYLQANCSQLSLYSKDVYRTEADKIKLQQLRKLYMDREVTFPYHWDVPVACALLKAFISELPESILTQELHGQFEQATAMAEPQREATMTALVAKLPPPNRSLLGWLMRHFDFIAVKHRCTQADAQSITAYMGPALNMSLNLITYLMTNSEQLFPEVTLEKYVPPLLTIPADFPDSAQEMSAELRKQESLLSQIHAEMHAGFITAARDQQLWEAQRIVTQLKRKLRSVQKSVEPHSLPPQQPSIDEKTEDEPAPRTSQSNETQVDGPVEPITPSTDSFPVFTETKEFESPNTDPTFPVEFEDNFDLKFETDIKESPPPQFEETPPSEPFEEKPKLTEKELKVLRLELENAEYLQLKSLLQAKINSEQFEIVKLRSHVALKNKQEGNLHCYKEDKENYTPEEQELRQRLIKENAMLEQKRLSLINQIFQERVACIQLKIELALKEILSKS
ncbi:ral interacting protein isoform X2 [Choristoneura fumiferana]|uniref:ral interacting protein isoform X2 n=1 Tax=Choristoneura fumiferana TaxID=7141 RepID=UPI003D15E8C7